jgi:hypothetical protein
MSKLISFVCVLVFALSTLSYAVAPILVGNFENNYDSWKVGWGSGLAGFAGDGATLDALALRYVVAAGGWGDAWQLKLQGPTGTDLNNFHAQSMIPELFPGQGGHAYEGSPWNMVEMDITLIAAEWTDDGDPATTPSIEMKLVLNTGGMNADGVETGVWGDSGNVTLALDATTHCVWDISAAIASTVALWNQCYTASDQYYELMLVPLSNGYAGNTTYHIDAAYLTPEPATIALLGLGGLSLIRRKR